MRGPSKAIMARKNEMNNQTRQAQEACSLRRLESSGITCSMRFLFESEEIVPKCVCEPGPDRGTIRVWIYEDHPRLIRGEPGR